MAGSMLVSLLSLYLVQLIMTPVHSQGSHTWDCASLTPNLQLLRNEPASSAETNPYQIYVESTNITAGQSVAVRLTVKPDYPDAEITGFMLQMRQVPQGSAGSLDTATPQGTWSIPDSNIHATTTPCSAPTDTATNKELFGVKGHDLLWTAPANVPQGYMAQVVGGAMHGGNPPQYWNFFGTSGVVHIAVTPAITVVQEDEEEDGQTEEGNEDGEGNTGGIEDPDVEVTSMDEEDEHDLLAETRMEKEWQERKEAEIAMENLATETDALASLETEKKQHEAQYKWEMEDFEKRMYDEELRRQARIDAELRDKEEWEAQQHEEQMRREEEERRLKEERRAGNRTITLDGKPGKASDAVRETSTFSLYVCFVAVLLCLL